MSLKLSLEKLDCQEIKKTTCHLRLPSLRYNGFQENQMGIFLLHIHRVLKGIGGGGWGVGGGGGAVTLSVERATPCEEVLDPITAVAARSLLFGSVSV